MLTGYTQYFRIMYYSGKLTGRATWEIYVYVEEYCYT